MGVLFRRRRVRGLGIGLWGRLMGGDGVVVVSLLDEMREREVNGGNEKWIGFNRGEGSETNIAK